MTEHDSLLREWKMLFFARDGAGIPLEESPFAVAGMDADMACLARLAHLPAVQNGSVSRGAVLCVAGEKCLTAVLFWHGSVFAFYRHRLAARSVAEHCRDMAEFRLGWLPEESILASGGMGSAFATLPAEAEGFPLLCIAGPNASVFAGCGKIYETLA